MIQIAFWRNPWFVFPGFSLCFYPQISGCPVNSPFNELWERSFWGCCSRSVVHTPLRSQDLPWIPWISMGSLKAIQLWHPQQLRCSWWKGCGSFWPLLVRSWATSFYQHILGKNMQKPHPDVSVYMLFQFCLVMFTYS